MIPAQRDNAYDIGASRYCFSQNCLGPRSPISLAFLGSLSVAWETRAGSSVITCNYHYSRVHCARQVTSDGFIEASKVGSIMSVGFTAIGMRLMLRAHSLRSEMLEPISWVSVELY